MGTFNYMLYHSTGLNIGLSSLMYSIANFVKTKFSPGYFNHVEVNTRNEIINMYKDKQYRNKIRKIKCPKMVAIFNVPNNFKTTDSGLGQLGMLNYPSQGIPQDLRNYIPIFQDKNNITISVNDIRIRIEVNFMFDFNSKDDQIQFMTELYTKHKFHYGYNLENIGVDFMLPLEMCIALKSMLFSNNSSVEDSSIIFNNESQLEFENYLKTHSNGGIETKYIENADKKLIPFYIMKRIYKKLYYQASEEPDGSENNKKSDVYSMHRVTFPAFFEVWIPLNYVMVVPKVFLNYTNLVFKNNTGKFLFDTNKYDTSDCKFQADKLTEKTFLGLTGKQYYGPNNIELYKEKDIILTNNIEQFNIVEYITYAYDNMDEYKNNTNLNLLIQVLTNFNKDELKNKISVIMYSGKYTLDEGLFISIDNNWNVTIKNNSNENKNHTLVIIGDIEYIKRKVKTINT